MLRRRDIKTQDETTTEQEAQPQAQAQAAPVVAPAAAATTAASSGAADGSGISPGGLSWRPMRQEAQATAAPETPSAQRRASTGEESVIGPDDFFNGNYRSERGVRVQGRVEGSVESKGHILIEEQAQVSADMKAEDSAVAGRCNRKVE